VKEFVIQVKNQTWGSVVFEDSSRSDILKNHQIPEKRDFYQEFYAGGTNPLKKTREIQFQQLWCWLQKFSHPQKCLDVGCGRGEFVAFLRANGCESYGVEPALKSDSEFLKKMGIEEVAINTSIPREYSLVSLLDVLEHFPDTNETVEKVSRFVAKEGIFLVKVPNKEATFYQLAKVLRGIFPKISAKIFFGLYQVAYPPPHFVYFSAASLQASLAKHFQILAVHYISECPVGGLWTRFWMVPKFVRPLVMIAALFYRILSVGKGNDGIVIIAKKR
jgi:SAM-dependent methyltransferase